jgi:hypothetical protein
LILFFGGDTNSITVSHVEENMPIDDSLTDSGRGILLRGQGIVEGEDLLKIKRKFLSDPDAFTETRYWLVDLSDTIELRMTLDQLTELIEIERQLAITVPDSMVAVAAPADSVYGFARMWEMKIEGVGWKTSVFRDLADAKSWINARAGTQTTTSNVGNS